jgi:hypothetical protein
VLLGSRGIPVWKRIGQPGTQRQPVIESVDSVVLLDDQNAVPSGVRRLSQPEMSDCCSDLARRNGGFERMQVNRSSSGIWRGATDLTLLAPNRRALRSVSPLLDHPSTAQTVTVGARSATDMAIGP